MKKLIFCLALIAGAAINGLQAQNLYLSKDGHIKFFSDAPLEDIEANNHKVGSVMNIENGDIEFSVLIMAFQFEKALMQEHFNENYMESAKYPKATFKGKIVNFDEVNFASDGTYPAEVEGELTIRGVAKPVKASGLITVKGEEIQVASDFMVAPADYNIEIPGLVREKIAKEIKVSVANTYKPYKKS